MAHHALTQAPSCLSYRLDTYIPSAGWVHPGQSATLISSCILSTLWLYISQLCISDLMQVQVKVSSLRDFAKSVWWASYTHCTELVSEDEADICPPRLLSRSKNVILLSYGISASSRRDAKIGSELVAESVVIQIHTFPATTPSIIRCLHFHGSRSGSGPGAEGLVGPASMCMRHVSTPRVPSKIRRVCWFLLDQQLWKS